MAHIARDAARARDVDGLGAPCTELPAVLCWHVVSVRLAGSARSTYARDANQSARMISDGVLRPATHLSDSASDETSEAESLRRRSGFEPLPIRPRSAPDGEPQGVGNARGVVHAEPHLDAADRLARGRRCRVAFPAAGRALVVVVAPGSGLRSIRVDVLQEEVRWVTIGSAIFDPNFHATLVDAGKEIVDSYEARR